MMEWRAPTIEDRARILALLAESEIAEAGAVMSNLADVDDLLATPGLDLARRARIYTEDDRAIAFVALHRAPQPGELRAHVILSPEARGNAATLLTAVSEWSRSDRPTAAPVTTTLFALPGFVAREALLDDGWEVVHSYTRMHARLDSDRSVSLQENVTIRAAESQADMATVHAVLEDAVAGHWKHQRRTFTDFLRDQEARAGHNPALWLLAERAGEPAGAVIARDPADRAWIAWLGVHPRHRHRGVANALLHTVFDELRHRGHQTVGVDVDTHNQTGANAVYEHAGMAVTGRADQWSKTYT